MTKVDWAEIKDTNCGSCRYLRYESGKKPYPWFCAHPRHRAYFPEVVAQDFADKCKEYEKKS